MNETLELTAVEPRIAKLAEEHQIEPSIAQSLAKTFQPFFVKSVRLIATSRTVTDPAIARTVRLELKEIRVTAEKERKRLKESSVRLGRAIDGVNNLLLVDLSPAEKAMENIERAEEIRKKKERDELLALRRAEIATAAGRIGASECYGESLADMDQATFSSLVTSVRDARMKYEEAARIAVEAENKRKAEAAAENERLRRETEESRAALRAEQMKRDAEAAALKAEAERRLADERAAKQAAEAEASRLRRIAAKKEAAEKEAAAKAKSDEDRRIAEELARKQKMEEGSDVEKMSIWLNAAGPSIRSLPKMTTPRGIELVETLGNAILDCLQFIEVK